MTSTETEIDPETEAPASRRVQDASTFKVADYLKGVVTLPKDSVTVYTDGNSAWQYHRLIEQEQRIQDAINQATEAKLAAQAANPQPRTISEPPPDESPVVTDEQLEELKAMEDTKAALQASLRNSGIVVHMTALYPKHEEALSKKADVRTSEHFKDKETPSKDDRERYRNETYARMTVTDAVEKIVLSNGDEVIGPFSESQLREFEDLVDADEWSKVYALYRELATRAAIREATVDAGFPSRSAG